MGSPEDKLSDATTKDTVESVTLEPTSNNDDWLDDPRIAFNQQSNKWIFEDPDTGAEYEYDEKLAKWISIINHKPSIGEENELELKKRKAEDEELDDLKADVNSEIRQAKKNKKLKIHKNKEAEERVRERKNKAIYITGLPKDVTVEELDSTFSKYGIIAEDFSSEEGTKRVKLYKDKETGEPKGDALIVYFKSESVDLAVQIMDGIELRPGDESTISVQPAEFKAKNKDDTNQAEPPALDGRKKKVLQKKYEKLNQELAGWDDDDDEQLDLATKVRSKRWEKTVILKHVFTLEELEADPNAKTEIQEDILAGCEDIGPVSSVVMFDAEKDGVCSVKFEEKEDAIECVKVMNGRFFGGKTVLAEIYDGLIRYKKKKVDEKEESERLEEFGNWLEKET